MAVTALRRTAVTGGYPRPMKALGLAILLCVLLPAHAAAYGQPVVAPGNASLNQYLEDVPTAKGDRPADGLGSSAGSGPRALPASTRSALLRSGALGRRVVTLAQGGAPLRARAVRREPQRATIVTPQAPSSVLGTTLASLGGGAGMGIALPIILIATVVVVAVGAWRQRSE